MGDRANRVNAAWQSRFTELEGRHRAEAHALGDAYRAEYSAALAADLIAERDANASLLLTATEAARLAGVTPGTLRGWVRHGILAKSPLFAAAVYVRRSDLLALIEGRPE